MSLFFRISIILIVFFIILGLLFSPFLFQKVQADVVPTSVVVTVCGNNIREGTEQCDGTDLGGQTCVSRGYAGGTLSCYPAGSPNQCTFNVSNCNFGGGGGGGVYVPPPAETKVIIQGLAYPKANVTVMKDGVIVGTIPADPMANFKIELTNVTAGIWTFSLWAEDGKGRRSPTFSFTTTITANMTTTISNIFLPPTIDLTTEQVRQGENIGILGQTAPQSEVTIFVYSPAEPITKKVKADSAGAYFYNLDTTPLELGPHSTKSKATNVAGLVTDFSKTLTFQVLPPTAPLLPPQLKKCIAANLNCDFDKKGNNIVNFVDVSILLYNWGKPKAPKTDLNSDGKVNYTDLSILLYYWTG